MVQNGFVMEISVTDAKAQLTDLVRRAEAGEDVVLTRHGQPAVRLAPVRRVVDMEARRELIQRVRKAGGAKASPGLSAARSQDFLYGDDGMPE
jgi:prevent-host-death family protein